MKKSRIDYNNLFEDKNFHLEVGNNIWLMDDHKWAFFAWWKYFSKTNLIEPCTLIHIDYHWDAINDFNNSLIDKLNNLNEEKVTSLISQDFIRKDSFIAPAVILGYFNKIHFYCKQFDNEIGFYIPFIDKYGVEQVVNRNFDFLSNYNLKTPCMVDIDIDIFNNSDNWAEGDLWNNSEINQLIKYCKNVIKYAKVVTIAISFNYSGSINDTKKLTRLIVPRIIEYRKSKV